jgi:CheY-like chemotaxis protein
MLRKTILMVDDEPIVTGTLALIVNRFPREFFAIGSNSVAEALTLDGEIQPDLVLLDVFIARRTWLAARERNASQHGKRASSDEHERAAEACEWTACDRVKSQSRHHNLRPRPTWFT